MKQLPISSLRINSLTEQLYLQDSSFEQLLRSVSLFGVLEPLIVFPLNDNKSVFQIVSGNRRYYASQELGHNEIPCVIIDAILDALESNTNCQALYIQVSTCLSQVVCLLKFVLTKKLIQNDCRTSTLE